MVAHLLRLRLRLLGNSFRRSPWQLVALIVGLLYGLGMALVVASALFGLRLAPVSLAASAVTVFGAILVLGFLLVPLVFGTDDAMDPRTFAVYDIPTGRLATGLATASLVGVPAVAVALIGLAQIVTWARGLLPVLFAVVGAAVILATCLLSARVTTSLAAFLLSTRRSRDATGVLGIVILLLLAPGFISLLTVDWQHRGLSILEDVARVVGWTPLGAVWAAPADAAAGQVGAALLKELIAIAFVGGLWLAWRALVALMLVTPQRQAHARRYGGLGFFRLLPSSPTAAVAARSFTYWVRDARYHVSLLIIPIVPLILMLPLMIGGVPTNVLALLPVPVIALFLGWSIHNDIAYDNTAVWLHIASSVPGRADRLGRAIPALVVGIPVIVIASVTCSSLFGDPASLPAILGVGLGLLLSGLGFSSVMSAAFPYPAVRPGDSPFAQPQAAGSASAFIQSVSFIVTAVLAGPTFVFAFLFLIQGGDWGWAALVSGIALGTVILVAGVLLGGRIFERRSPAILAFTMRN
ncbi:hypothetical protein [Galbitalea soli]|uniref:Uncharacterized protein n=1 Tax=Galbitalea soli TaxID=1268042 RepID=A0A7C9TPI5_9MICO|nr:hypothetical protein [Galbitalea soli]NEM90555.1 hypothetical protein [Galbitalea soli]NYJ31270.1 ABC-2 type transport system permease protein [Galbitalea soli]